ncbi:MAG: glutamate--cysteine ligase [Bdellovibrionaceae bacterium]|nr:glutamate--cysteine ligase [Pseudobdellovibrionaceae bacterium]
MIQELIHNQICKNLKALEAWYEKTGGSLAFPIYSSFDIRDSGSKACPVDANIFPAGFNNICDVDKENSIELMKQYLTSHYPQLKKFVVLLTEEHTQNAYYWENVYTIKKLIESSGFQVKVAIPREFEGSLDVKSIHENELKVYSANKKNGSIIVDGQEPELVVNNNDFSSDYSNWIEGLNVPMNPPFQLGWYWRRKEDFFKQYNILVEEFARIIDVPKIVLQLKTLPFKNFNINDEASRKELGNRVDEFLSDLEREYKESGISTKPFAFVKNSSGTYGLGVVKVNSGSEILEWSYKSRKKMKAAKGGGGINEVIIQEGIPTKYQTENEIAEPAIYLIGKKLAGGFLRTHSKKGPDDNLNSPGAVYKRLCVSDLNVDLTRCPSENVYGWLAKIGVLAIAIEAREAKVKFMGYQF